MAEQQPTAVPPEEATTPEAEISDDSEDEWLAPAKGEDQDSAAKVREVDIENLDADEKELAGEAVPIQFNLPDGTTAVRKYFMGHTIAYIKGHLEDVNGLPYHLTTLKMNGKVLIDPLSLNDLPFEAGKTNVVDVLLEKE